MGGTHVSTPTKHYGAQAVNTSATSTANEFNGGATHVVTKQAAASSSQDIYITAPCDGKIESVSALSELVANTTDEIKALVITNLSAVPTSAVAALQTLSLAALTPLTVTLSTTSGALDVDQGDLLKATLTTSVTTESIGALSVKFIEGFKDIPT